MKFTSGNKTVEIPDNHPLVGYIGVYNKIFTPEEKQHIALVFKGNVCDLVGREDLKKRLMAALFPNPYQRN